MHDEIARRKRGDFVQEIGGLLRLAALAHETVAQNILFGDDDEIAGLKALLHASHRQRDFSGRNAQRLRQRRDRLCALQPMLAQNGADAVARAVRPARDDDAALVRLRGAHMCDDGIEHIDVFIRPLRREIAPDMAAAIEHAPAVRRGEGRDADRHIFIERLAPAVGRKIERVRGQRLVGRACRIGVMLLLARLVIIPDLRKSLARSIFCQRVEKQRCPADIVEQGVGATEEQRQPMFHADMAAAFADRLVKRIAARLRAKLHDIGLAEALHRLAGELHLAHRHEIERPQLARRALALGIEGTDGFQRVAEKVEPHGGRHARRIEIENAAAHRIFAGLAHGTGAQEAVVFQPADQLVHIDGIARCCRKAFGRRPFQRRDALQQRIDRGGEHTRAFLGGLRPRKARQHQHPLGRNRRIGRHAVIGLAIPAREIEQFEIGGREGKGLLKGARPLPVARDMHEHGRTAMGGTGHHAGEISGD